MFGVNVVAVIRHCWLRLNHVHGEHRAVDFGGVESGIVLFGILLVRILLVGLQYSILVMIILVGIILDRIYGWDYLD